MRFWIARDEDDSLYLYDNVPVKKEICFQPQRGYEMMKLDDRLFPEVTFANSPQEVELKLTKQC
jgi:hypothetical protein